MLLKSAGCWLLALVMFFPLAASAQNGPFSMASADPGTSTYNTVLAIAKVAGAYGLDIRPRPFKGTTQAISFVDDGEVNFGLESARGVLQAYTGTGVFDGTPFTNLRLIGTIYPFRVGLIVRADSPIRTLADLRGRTIVTGFRASPNITALVAAILATGGLSAADVQGIDVPTSNDANDLFINGEVEVALGGVDTPSTAQLIQSVGEVRYIELPSGADASAGAQAFLPNSRVITIDPMPSRLGVSVPTAVLEYDYFIYCSTSTPDDVVVKLIHTMVNSKAQLTEMIAGFEAWEPSTSAAQIGVPYHPAAEAHYKELGLWPNP